MTGTRQNLLLVAGLAGVVGLAVLTWWVREPGPPGVSGPVARVESPRGAARLEPAWRAEAPAARRATGAGERPRRGETDSARELDPEEDPWHYGVEGKVEVVGLDDFSFQGARIVAVDTGGFALDEVVDSDGTFRLYGLGPREWELTARVPGIGVGHEGVILAPSEPVAQVLLQLLPPSSVRVQVTSAATPEDGELVEGFLMLVAHHLPPAGPDTLREGLQESSSAGLGTWLLLEEGAAECDLLFVGERPGYLTLFDNQTWVASRPLGAGEHLVQWHLEREVWPPAPASLRLTLLDPVSGAPLEAHLVLQARGGARDLISRLGPESLTRRADGSLLVENLRPGWVLATVSFEQRAVRREWRFLAPGQTHELRFLLEDPVRLSGRVLDGDGTPTGALLYAWRLTADGSVDPLRQQTRTKNDGHFSFRQLRPGRYLIRAAGPDDDSPLLPKRSDKGSDLVEVEAFEDVGGVEVRLLPTGELILDPLEAPPRPWAYRVENARGRVLHGGVLATAGDHRLTLIHGTHRLIVLDGEAERGRWDVQIGGEPTRVQL